ncbi:MAG TPA: hypothetical protein VFW02_08210 [Candidatus Limnocylindrales bacterium]|nr:hypothetical protein [Candidatus Limnocylindrales bacterium]
MIRADGSGVAVTAIKSIHTAVFLVNLSSIVWLVVTGLTGRRDRTVAVAAIAVAIESAVFLANDGICPLTQMTERFGAPSGSVSDIFLPDVVARTIPVWATALVVLGSVLHVRSALRRPATRACPTG